MKYKTDPKQVLKYRMMVARHDAIFAFWAEVAKHFPDATGGDLDPHSVFYFDEMADELIEEWTATNIPSKESN
jgi:hypothetical protein